MDTHSKLAYPKYQKKSPSKKRIKLLNENHLKKTDCMAQRITISAQILLKFIKF